jgi:hypothetical protein
VGSLGNGRAKRVGRLEETVPVPPCPECGHGDYTSGPPTYELLFDDDHEEEIPEGDVYCDSCGQLVFGVIRFPDDEDL